MNPPSEYRFPRIPFAKADAGASPGVVAFLKDIVDVCVMECYFHEHMTERDLLFHANHSRTHAADHLQAVLKEILAPAS